MTDAANTPIEDGDTVDVHPSPSSEAPKGRGVVYRQDPDNLLVFVDYRGGEHDGAQFGVPPSEVVVVACGFD